jgi:hypothetical protein
MTITLKVSDLSAEDRRALEHLLGHSLREGDQVELKVETQTDATAPVDFSENYKRLGLPDWMHVYKGLTEAEIEELESAILDRDRNTRACE